MPDSLTIQSVLVNTLCPVTVALYSYRVPKLWNNTIETHRRAVHDATLNAAASLIAEHGITSVTMSQIAKETGIGRATLYKYFPDVESILLAWHAREVSGHLNQLAHAARGPGSATERLKIVLEAYALTAHERHNSELVALLHRGEHVSRAQKELHHFVCDLITEAAKTGDLRDDVVPRELAAYCLHALTAASSLSSKAAVRRLVEITLAGLRPPR